MRGFFMYLNIEHLKKIIFVEKYSYVKKKKMSFKT